MNHLRHTTAEAFDACGVELSAIRADDRSRLSAAERVALMRQARRVADQFVSLACVLTDEAASAALPATGTPLDSLIGQGEGRDSRDASRQVLDARDLNARPATRDEALAGHISPRHASAIAQGMNQLPDGLTPGQTALAEAAFIRRASRNTPKALAGMAEQVLAEIAPELVPPPGDDDAALVAQRRRARTKRHFRWGDDGDGSLWFKGSLPHLEAATLIATLQAYVESDRRAERDRYKATRTTRPPAGVMQDQVADDNLRTPDQRRADALVDVIADHRDVPVSIGDTPRIVVTIREEDLRERAKKAGILATGAKIAAGDLRRMCCDADLMPVVLGSQSEILDVGRTHRLVTSAIRRALTLRDGGCIFTGCTAHDSRCEAHHIRPWRAGGATALSNLALLCPHHHKLVEPSRYQPEEDRWRIHMDRNTGKPVLTPPRRTDAFHEMAAPTLAMSSV